MSRPLQNTGTEQLVERRGPGSLVRVRAAGTDGQSGRDNHQQSRLDSWSITAHSKPILASGVVLARAILSGVDKVKRASREATAKRTVRKGHGGPRPCAPVPDEQ
ncbi:hypothetical protein TgHK011_009511 [Trichoderma gracile]|nr:hypothetical protein TgHK011_009511 [Trichoderma gracile]